MKERDLKEGVHFNFNNENWCENVQSDDLVCGWVSWCKTLQNFAIFFNGACIYTSKTFRPLQKRLKKLMEDWNCEFVPEDSI
jgi:hypothetical protein